MKTVQVYLIIWTTLVMFRTEGDPGPRFEDKFRSANQMDGISIAGGGKMADS